MNNSHLFCRCLIQCVRRSWLAVGLAIILGGATSWGMLISNGDLESWQATTPPMPTIWGLGSSTLKPFRAPGLVTGSTYCAVIPSGANDQMVQSVPAKPMEFELSLYLAAVDPGSSSNRSFNLILTQYGATAPSINLRAVRGSAAGKLSLQAFNGSSWVTVAADALQSSTYDRVSNTFGTLNVYALKLAVDYRAGRYTLSYGAPGSDMTALTGLPLFQTPNNGNGLVSLALSGALSQADYAIDNVVVTDRHVAVCVLSWYSPMGALNGTTAWKGNGYLYSGAKASNGVQNYPLDTNVVIQQTPPTFGSDYFYAKMKEMAIQWQRQMLATGFDVMSFDMQPMPAYDSTQALTEFNSPLAQFKTFLKWIEAGEQTGIKVGVMPDIWAQSQDYPTSTTLSATQWTNSLLGVLNLTPDSPVLWKMNNKPVVIHFGTDISRGGPAPIPGAPMPDGGWRNVLGAVREAGRDLFFIADIRPNPDATAWNTLVDGAHSFMPAAPLGALGDQSIIDSNFTIPFIRVVSSGYYRQSVAFTQPDFHRIHDTYLAAMADDVKYLYALTWNDFEEDDEIVPTANKGRCLSDLFTFYNQWYRTGQLPVLASDKVIIAYPMRLPATVVTPPPVAAKLTAQMASTGQLWDSPSFSGKLFYWANMKTASVLSIPGVGTASLPLGVSMGQLGPIHAGSMQAQLGTTLKNLPSVVATTTEQQRSGTGGLEYRYVDVTALP